jgi:hypothetical protein
MGVFWTDPLGATSENSDAPEPSAGVSFRCPGRERDPDTVVRPGGARRSEEADGPYDLIPERRRGRVAGCVPRATDPRAAAPVISGGRHRAETLTPEPARSDSDE